MVIYGRSTKARLAICEPYARPEKLDDKSASPFRVTRQVGTRAYELDLPAEMELRTRVFHAALLELARTDPLPGQVNPPAPPVIVRGHQEWLVEDILDFRWHRGTLQYRVQWQGHHERIDIVSSLRLVFPFFPSFCTYQLVSRPGGYCLLSLAAVS